MYNTNKVNTEMNKIRIYDNMCFAVTAYILFGVGAVTYGNNHNNDSNIASNEKNNIAAILVKETKISSKDLYNDLSKFRRV